MGITCSEPVDKLDIIVNKIETLSIYILIIYSE